MQRGRKKQEGVLGEYIIIRGNKLEEEDHPSIAEIRPSVANRQQNSNWNTRRLRRREFFLQGGHKDKSLNPVNPALEVQPP